MISNSNMQNNQGGTHPEALPHPPETEISYDQP